MTQRIPRGSIQKGGLYQRGAPIPYPSPKVDRLFGGQGGKFGKSCRWKTVFFTPEPFWECQVYAELLFRGAVQQVLYIRRIKS